MIDLEVYFKQEAARYRLPKQLADNLAKRRSERAAAGNRTRAARRARA